MSTEDRNSRTADIDLWPTDRVVDALLAEDAMAVEAARAAGPALAKAVDLALPRLAAGGRVHYFGAGASGRLAVLDATETTPTFGVPQELVTAALPGRRRGVRRLGPGLRGRTSRPATTTRRRSAATTSRSASPRPARPGTWPAH